jgi:choline dehydrogenase-like flavoprotein
MARSLGTFDYVVVGGGTAGCVLANRLSAAPDTRVLLIEAGGRDRWIWIDIPVGYIYCIGNPRTDWCYRTEPCAGLNGRSILYARGKVLGGCSSINAMIYMRGQREDYDAWADATGDAGWSWERVLPLFKRSEDHHRGAGEFHGAGGEWRVERQRLGWEILDAFQAAAEEIGIRPIEDFNTGANEGSGKFEVNQRRGVRWSASKAFLRPIQQRPNLTVVTDALVRRLVLSGRRVTGVEIERAGEVTAAEARVETVLAAGSIGTPQIMQLSGIGPAGLLERYGIAVAHELPGVGENLQDHLQLRMAFRVRNVRTLNQVVHSMTGKARIGLEYLLFRTGPLTMAPSQLGLFTRSSPEHARPNIEFHIQPLSLDRFGEPLHTFPAFTVSVCNLRPTSRGSVRITSPDPRQAPAIQPDYLSAPEDQRVAIDSLRLGRRIARGAALARYQPEEFVPGLQFESDAELVKAAGDVGTTIFHPIGTCRMGRADDPSAVVDPRLRVRGLDGLRVVDASVMPTITSGNTNSPVIMIAERASDLIIEDWRRSPVAAIQ